MTEKQDCPLCQTAAEFQFADGQKRKHFFCPECTEFQISLGAEKRIRRAPSSWRAAASAKAKSGGKDRVLVILLVKAGGEEPLSAEWCLRAELPA
jgi:predicted RNA-binding Zn-ribbon protein involved in translation (DUF1610 family)